MACPVALHHVSIQLNFSRSIEDPCSFSFQMILWQNALSWKLEQPH